MSSIDMSEVMKLSADFGHASARALPAVDRVVERGALNVKTKMAAEAESDGHYKRFSRAISYDRAYKLGVVSYEVGPDKSRSGAQGALGNLLYFGSANNGSVLDIEVGLRDEEPRLVENLAKIATDLAAGRG